jgi:transmembrane 9 superfamily protein 2/4
VQLFLMTLATLTFALLGLLSPDNRGSLGTGLVFLFVFMGSSAGYCSARAYKLFRGLDWNRNTALTAFFFPSVLFSVFSVINIALMIEGSSGALPFSALLTLLFLWLCVSVPLVFLGSFYGYRKELAANPVRTNQIPRAVPEQPWYMSLTVTSILCGVLPFAAVSLEVSFIMSALWLHQIYYIFGFLLLVLIVLVVTCAEVSILLCYFQLRFEDYQWWWRSFLSGGACAGYLFLYALWYNLTRLDMSGAVAFLIYFGYMTLICFTFFLITGTIGYFSCLWFNWQIYSSIKVD